MRVNYKKYVIGFLFYSAVSSLAHSGLYQDIEGSVVNATLLTTSEKVEENRSGFIESFALAYKDISLDVLKVNDKEKFLNDAFQEEIRDFGKGGLYNISIVNDQNCIVGYFSFENINERKMSDSAALEEYKDFPEKSAYIRQLFVTPAFQRKGLGTLMVSKVLYEYFPNAEHVYVATRRINDGARNLYEKCGFNENKEVLHGLPVERYMSFEKHLT